MSFGETLRADDAGKLPDLALQTVRIILSPVDRQRRNADGRDRVALGVANRSGDTARTHIAFFDIVSNSLFAHLSNLGKPTLAICD